MALSHIYIHHTTKFIPQLLLILALLECGYNLRAASFSGLLFEKSRYDRKMKYTCACAYVYRRGRRGIGTHAEVCSAKGTLAVPFWKSAVYWPLLCHDGVHLAPFIHSWFLQPFYEGLIHTGCSGGNLGDSEDSMFLFIDFDFSTPARSSSCGFCLTDSGVC